MRRRSTDRSGRSFSAYAVQAVWERGQIVPGRSAALVRKDACGAWIQRDMYGRTDSSYGWEVDHIRPVAKDGSDAIVNLQPLQWQNNRHKGDSYPNWTCAVHAT